MTYKNGYSEVKLVTVANRYVISNRHGDTEVSVVVDAETIRNMARHVENEESKK